MAMRVRNDVLPYWTDINAKMLTRASKLVAAVTSFPVQYNKAIVGRNAFAHEAGIHQDGYLKNKSTYEIIDPKSVGVPEGKLVLGKHSGRHALNQRCQDLGFSLTREELDALYHRFTALADRKKGVLNEEIVALIEHAHAKQAAAD
jgi:2-isopropylmalate synthase